MKQEYKFEKKFILMPGEKVEFSLPGKWVEYVVKERS